MGTERRLPPDNPITLRAHSVSRSLEPGGSVVRVLPSSERLMGRKLALLDTIIDRLHVRLESFDGLDMDTVKMARMAQQMLVDIRKDERESDTKQVSEMTDEEIVTQLGELGIEVKI